MKPEEIFIEGMKRFELARLADWEQRKLAVEDLLFINAEDGQWAEDVVTKRKDRPRYTIDRISGSADQIVGNQRQTRTGIKIEPQKDADEKTAEIFTGLIRSIEQLSNADNAYDSAFYEQLLSGYGGWRVLHDYEGDDTFDQTIKIKPINSAASSLYFDPSAEEYDRRDAKYAFLTSYLPTEVFKETHPEAAVSDFSTDRFKTDNLSQWFGEKGVRIAEYWYKKPYKRKIALLSDGRTIDLEDEKKVLDEISAQGITIVREREVESYTIEMVIMSGVEVLTEPQKWAGKYIPLVPVFGRSSVVDSHTYTRGIVRKAKDSQRIYNYATSSAIEATALTPKDPYWITPSQAKGYESELRTFNTTNSPFMLYNPDPTAPGPPQRTGAPQLQTALLQQVSQAETDIYATTGMSPPSLGASVPELKSGKAIQAEQAMGDRGSYIFQNNLEKSQQYTGVVLVDLIPRIYDTERVVKILGPDETFKEVTINGGINQEIEDTQTGEKVLVNDLSKGSYSVNVKTGPSFSTKRKETVDQLVTLAGASPIIQELALDLIIDNMDLNKGDEIKARVRKSMIQEGKIEPTEEEIKELGLDQPTQPDPMQEALRENVEVQTQEIISRIEKNDAETEAKIIAAQKDSVSALTSLMETFIKKIEAGLNISANEIETLEGQQALVQETQLDVMKGQELARSAPIGAQEPIQEEIPMPPPAELPPITG